MPSHPHLVGPSSIPEAEAERITRRVLDLPYATLSPVRRPSSSNTALLTSSCPTSNHSTSPPSLPLSLRRSRVIHELLLNAGHGDPALEAPESVRKVLDFLDSVLRP